MNLDYSKIIADSLVTKELEPVPLSEEIKVSAEEIVRPSNEEIAEAVRQELLDAVKDAIQRGDAQKALDGTIQLIRECREEPELPPKAERSPIICHHICTCGREWSHGPYKNCKSPDIVEVAPCYECMRELASEATMKEMSTVNEGVGESGLTGAREIQVRNIERATCSEMSLEQLQEHIEKLHEVQHTFRVKELEAKRIQKGKEEQELSQLLTEDEKEAWRRRKVAGLKEKKPPTEHKIKARQTQIEKTIKQMMGFGMTREQAETVLGAKS